MHCCVIRGLLDLSPLLSLRALCLTSCGLTSIDCRLGSLAALEYINLAGNALASLAHCGLGSLASLRDLRLDHNSLVALPPELGECHALRTLHVSFNMLTSIPSPVLDLLLKCSPGEVDFLNDHNAGCPLYDFFSGDGGKPVEAAGSEADFDAPAAVRASCAWVMGAAQHVTISRPALAALAQELAAMPTLAPPPWGELHYEDDLPMGSQTMIYVAVLDAINFCFWPQPGLEYDALALGLRAVLRANPDAFSCAALVGMTPETVRGWTTPPLPNADVRAACLRELGAALQESFGGSFRNLVAAAKGSCVALLRLILKHFPAFRDTAEYSSGGELRRVHFYKRAQILCGDLLAAFGVQSPIWGDAHALTCFADYRLPQLFRDKGVLVYSEPLASAVDGGEVLPSGGQWEVEIRAASVVVVEALTEALLQAGKDITAPQLDWLLWNLGEARIASMAPHHKCLGHYY